MLDSKTAKTLIQKTRAPSESLPDHVLRDASPVLPVCVWMCCSTGRSSNVQPGHILAPVQLHSKPDCSLTTDNSGKFSIYTIFGMRIAWEVTPKKHCVCAGTGFSFKVLIGLYIQKSSWKHTEIFLPPLAAEIAYCHLVPAGKLLYVHTSDPPPALPAYFDFCKAVVPRW